MENFVSELITEKIHEKRSYQRRLIELNSEREMIINRFNKEYKALSKSIYEKPFGNNWKLRSEIKSSTKMKKYQRDLIKNKTERKDLHSKISVLKIAIRTLNIANTKSNKNA
jgi:hypothetical protein